MKKISFVFFLFLFGFFFAPPVYAAPNLISNPSVETASGGLPLNWQKDRWGNNTASFSYVTGGAQNGTKSVRVNMTTHVDGDAKWFFNPVSVTGNTSYAFSHYYKSNVYTEVLAQFTDSQNNKTYQYMGLLAPKANWTNWSANVVTPANTVKVTILHIIGEVGWLQTDNFSLMQSSASDVQVAVTSPAAGSTVACTTMLGASITGTGLQGGVQFLVDGVNVGSPDTTYPYTYLWDSTTVADGAHSVSASITDIYGVTKIATPTAITTLNNPSNIPAGNLLANGSVEKVNCADTSTPHSWYKDSWGENDATFEYLSSGHTGNRSVKVSMTSHTDGDAKWLTDPTPVNPNSLYEYTEWYKTNAADNEIIVQYTRTNGTRYYQYIANPVVSSDWKKYSVVITTYADTAAILVLHTLNSTGYVVTDDYSLVPYTPNGFTRGIVSLTFDDGLVNQYNSALPLLNQYGMKSTMYLVSGLLNTAGYVTSSQALAMRDSGHEIASHTVNHFDLTTLNAAGLAYQLSQSKVDLQGLLGVTVDDFASPYGLYNAATIGAISQEYASHRTTDVGYNSKDGFDLYKIVVQNLTSDTTPEMVAGWVNAAKNTNTWLVLVYHDIGGSGTFNTPIADFEANLQAISQSGITVKTVDDALTEIKPQVGL